MSLRPLLMCATALFTIAAAPPEKGEPPLTEQTMRSGGPVAPEQAALRFDLADLAFEVFPATETLKGVATLHFTAKSPLSRLLIDLDRNLPASAISVNGKDLPRSAWSNPEGRLTITLPKQAGAGDKIVARITYGGVPP